MRASSYDLLITDIKIPVIDGMELLKTVSEEKLCPCVVLLSDYTEFAYAGKDCYTELSIIWENRWITREDF